jgi:hypothetical protein
MCVPFMFMPRMSVFFGAGRALLFCRVVCLPFALAFRLDFDLAFGFGIFMPGMSCMLCPSCCAGAALTHNPPEAVTKTAATTSAQTFVRNECNLFITSPLKYGERAGRPKRPAYRPTSRRIVV